MPVKKVAIVTPIVHQPVELVSPDDGKKHVFPASLMFFSKSKSYIGKYLSNFHLTKISYRGFEFASVEHAYQATKFLYALNRSTDDKMKYFRSLSVRGENGRGDALSAKRFGNKTNWKKLGLTMDASTWERDGLREMMHILKARYKSDPLFRQIIRKARKENIALLHNDRAATKSYWGGAFNPERNHFRGKNHLGWIMMRLH